MHCGQDAKAKLNLRISWHVQVACDPAVNGGFVLMPVVLDDAMQEVLRRDGYRALAAFIQNQDRLSA